VLTFAIALLKQLSSFVTALFEWRLIFDARPFWKYKHAFKYLSFWNLLVLTKRISHLPIIMICSLENVKSLKNEGLIWVAIIVSLPIFSITIAFPILSSADKVLKRHYVSWILSTSTCSAVYYLSIKFYILHLFLSAETQIIHAGHYFA
jgi:hypothetical protein